MDETADPDAARLYLVDHGWRNREDFGVVLTFPGSTLRHLNIGALTSLTADENDGGDAAGRWWTIEVLPREARIIVEHGKPRFPYVQTPSRRQAPVATAVGIGSYEDIDPIHHSAPEYVSPTYALNEGLNVAGTEFLHPDTPLREIPPNRPLGWTWSGSSLGMLRCLSTLPEQALPDVDDRRFFVLHGYRGDGPDGL